MLPVVRTAAWELRGGLHEYIRRRAWRILPPYYFLLAVSAIVIFFTKAESQPDVDHLFWHGMVPIFQWDVIASHLLLIHNFFPDYAHRFDAPMWSIAVEWQIYFIFALLLLPIARRFSVFAAVTCAFIVSAIIMFTFPSIQDSSSPWFIGLFSLGMAGAAINFPRQLGNTEPSRRLDISAWKWISSLTVGLGIVTILVLQSRDLVQQYRWQVDTLVGAGAACALIYLTMRGSGRVNHFLERRPIQWIGQISYSLYLTHSVVIAIISTWSVEAHQSPVQSALLLYLVALPLVIGCSYLVFLGVEAPSTRRRVRPAA